MRRFGWVFMRISGVLLIVLVVGHLVTNLVLGDGIRQVNFAFVAGKWASPFWQLWALLMLILALAHGANGIRTIIFDYARRPLSRGLWLGALGLVTGVIGLLGALVIFTFDPCPPGAPADLLPSFCPVL